MDSAESSPSIVTTLRRLSANLIGYEVESQFVNPLSFQASGIVDETWMGDPHVLIGLNHSLFSYGNGVEVEAAENTVSFRQHGISADAEVVPAIELAKRYAGKFDAENWMAVSLELALDVEVPAPGVRWPSFGNGLIFRELTPRTGVHVFYSFPDKALRVEVGPRYGADESGFFSFALVHRQLGPDPAEAQSKVGVALEGWKSDWEDVVTVVEQLMTSTLNFRSTQ